MVTYLNKPHKNKNKKKCVNLLRDMLIPILILVLAWFATEMDSRYPTPALVFLVLFLFLLAIFTW